MIPVILLGLFAAASAIELPGTFGYVSANSTYDVNYFYWYFDPANQSVTDPSLVLWLTGGPGCSSELALFFENGPYKVDKSATSLLPNQYGWNRENYLLYVDQPGGTGFSTVGNPNGYVTNEEQVAVDMHNFLTNLFKEHTHLAHLPLFIFGESYAGHYVPAISAYLVQNAPEINLKGIAVGNGFIDPGVQTASFGPFVYGNGMMNEQQLKRTQAGVPQCQQDIQNKEWEEAFGDCGEVLQEALQACSENKGSRCNVYNIKAPCNGPLCYDFQNIITFLNSEDVQSALGVHDIKWQSCDTTPYQHLELDFDKSYRDKLPIVLAAGVPVTIYNGNLDIICNFYGTSALLAGMDWSGASAFASATNTSWTVGGNAAGNFRTADGLTYVVVFDAGHMVPHDQPRNALSMMETVLADGWSSMSKK